MVKLTINEKKTLKFLLENGRISDTEIAKNLRITKQAVGKIRRKLEESGIVKGYTAKMDYGKLGLNTFAFAILRFTPKSWEDMGELGIEEKIANLPHVIDVYRIPEGSATHIALCGFRNLAELDEYFRTVKSVSSLNQYIQVEKIYIFSHHGFIKNSPVELLHKIIDEFGKEMKGRPLPIFEIDKFKEKLLSNL